MSKLDRIISLATLAASVTAIALVLRKPAPVVQTQSQPQIAAPTAEHGQSSDPKTPYESKQESQTAASATPATQTVVPTPQPSSAAVPPTTSSNAKSDSHLNSDQLSSMLERVLGGGSGDGSASLDAKVGEGEPNIKDQQVSMDGDVVHGKFLTEIGGKDVWVTISGHMGEKDGYATFDPTEIKVGDTDVPVSLVNPLLQKKMAEQRDKLKVPSSAQ